VNGVDMVKIGEEESHVEFSRTLLLAVSLV